MKRNDAMTECFRHPKSDVAQPHSQRHAPVLGTSEEKGCFEGDRERI